MIQIDEFHLKEIEKISSKTLVGELCHQLEEIERANLSTEISLSLFKNLLKNKIYESYRNNTNLVIQFSNGIKYFSVELQKPIKN